MPRKRIVKKGEDILKIAEEEGMTVSALLAANAGVSSINPGVTLSIPGTTALLGVDPKSPWTPDLPQPDPKDPYIPPVVIPPAPEPDLPEWFPKKKKPQPPGPADPKSPWTPDLPQPPPVQPFVPPITQLPPVQPQQPGYIPPAQSMAQLEAARVPQQPVVALTGAQPQPMVPQQRAGLIPGALRVAERVAPFLQRLFNREPLPTERRPGEPTAGARFAPIFSQEQVARGFQGIGQDIGTRLAEIRASRFQDVQEVDFAEGFPKGSLTAPGPATLLGAEKGRETFTAGELAAEQAAGAISQGGRGVQWYRMTMSEGREDRMFAYVWDEDTPQDELLDQRASHVAQSLARGDLPAIILESDRTRMKLSAEDMQNMGYIWDEEKGHWVHGERIEAPQTYGTSLPGWGGTYNYPRRGGYAPYTYPSYLPREPGAPYQSFVGREPGAPYQSFVGREPGAPYQSFVGREQLGRIPQQVQNRAARFGAVTWRI